MVQQLTIMFVTFDAVGHVNACIGLGERLRDRGHKIVFAVAKTWKGLLSKYGFIEEIIEAPDAEQFVNPGEFAAKILLESGLLSGISSLEKTKVQANDKMFEIVVKLVIETEPILKDIIRRHKPDLFIVDHFVGSPSVIYSDKPWVHSFSGNPLYVIEDERTPPKGSGYPIDGDRNDWKEFKKISDKLFESAAVLYNHWLKENGFPEISGNKPLPHSPFLNLYGFPEELDYTDVRPLPEKWVRIDAFIRQGEEDFKLPEELLNGNASGKLIYFSLGSMGSIDVNLMKRLVEILSKSPHKFIVSKGILHDKYELADNMWGEKSVPQTKVLPLVDLVITHGGNNTVTEAFNFGKPMIVMPLFADQYDNAQRIHEKGYGIRLDTYNCTEEELLSAIDKLLYDEKLKNKLTKASVRIQNSESITKAAQLIENLVK